MIVQQRQTVRTKGRGTYDTTAQVEGVARRGSAPRFLIYPVGKQSIKLIDDCQIVYVQSIGGPAAAKVARAEVHPIKFPQVVPAREAFARLQGTLEAPPPWLARSMGVEAKSLVQLAHEEETEDA